MEVTEVILSAGQVTNVDLSHILEFPILYHRASLWISFSQLRGGDEVRLPNYRCLYLNLFYFTLFLETERKTAVQRALAHRINNSRRPSYPEIYRDYSRPPSL
jgi:hypothetical protein